MQSHTVAVLAALWFCLGRCNTTDYLMTECDNGKLLVERDLPRDAIYWGCPASAWLDSKKRLSSVDTVYDPEPARQVCMNELISYRHSIPSSGAFRPVRAQSGEYLYCPPQRWLNNLHHGAPVMLYHPCAAFSERPLLSTLARSCLRNYIITPHPELNKSMPVALVSWGRTLELSTAASSDACDWLQSMMTSSNWKTGKYNFLLTQAAEQEGQKHTRQTGHHREPKESVRKCCEQIISLWLKGAIEVKKGSLLKSRNGKGLQGESRQKQKRAAIPRKRDGLKANGTFQVSSVLSNLKMKTIPENSSTVGAKTSSAKHNSPVHGQTLENVVEVRERELSQEDEINSLKGQDHSALPKHSRTEPENNASNTDNCGSCATEHQCDCVKDSKSRAKLMSSGLPRIPRSNEAVWAAAALGFLLVLLTLSVLHTRLYRHWRTMPSLYWHDTQQDYDRVADVIQRRLQIAKRRRKRGRRQECVLLPSSSSSDEFK
ncbi:tumor protein p53-inducible protein 13 [Corythoichthys intestinalis]|uniref:tumor protein p53-inducible protein 13 n=1 Tax=Corythoichthys intestinalis TaxID=161448 RepID=UPI0025A527BC|nr:tumor protein p53-inducible protein 13 [Corythoichthys intestinalis]